MKIILTLGMAFLTLTIYAQQTLKILTDVNVQWSVTEWQTQLTLTEGADHQEKIKVHLLETVRYLKSRSTSALSPIQLHNRKQAINQLEEYTSAGKFPQNEYLPYKTPIFIDNYNTHCAVGYLMQQSGDEPLAQTISTTENFEYVKDIKTQGVDHWASENGFILEELALIQPSYFEPINSLSKLYVTTPNPIKKMATYGQSIFMLLADTTFSNHDKPTIANYLITYYTQGGYAVSCNFPKTDSKPIDIAIFEDKLYVATSTQVYFADLNIPESESYQWQEEKSIVGDIKAIFSSNYGIVVHCESYGFAKSVFDNEFSTITYDGITSYCNYVTNGNFITLVAAQWSQPGSIFLQYSESDKTWSNINDVYSDFVVTGMTNHNDANFTYSEPFRNDDSSMNIGLYYFSQHANIPSDQIFDLANKKSDWRINDIVSTSNRLFVIGKFDKSLSVTNLPSKAILELSNSGSSFYYALPVTSLFEEVYAVTNAGAYLILSTNLGLYSYKTRLSSTSNLKENNINLYPNPINSGQTFTIDLATIKIVKVIDNMGRIILESTSGSVTIPEGTSTGVYQCHIETTEGSFYNERVMIH